MFKQIISEAINKFRNEKGQYPVRILCSKEILEGYEKELTPIIRYVSERTLDLPEVNGIPMEWKDDAPPEFIEVY